MQNSRDYGFFRVKSPALGTTFMRATIGLCLIYAFLAMNQLMSSRMDNFQTWGINKPQTTVLSGGISYLEYLLPSMIDEVDDITIFISEQSRLDNKGRELSLEVIGTTAEMRTIILGEANPNYLEYSGHTGDPAALSFYHLDASRPDEESSQIKLRITLQGDGELEFYALPRISEGSDSSLAIDGEQLTSLDLGVQLRELSSRRLWRLLLLGSILIATSIAILPGSALLPGVLVLTGFPMTLILAEFCWQFRLDQYWNYFWPDGYVELAHQIRLWLTGESGWSQMSGYLSSYRNGQSWLIPFFVALLSATGASYLLAFTLVNYLAGLVMVLAWLGLFRRIFPFASPVKQGLFVLVILFHYLHVFTAGTPMTDVGASAFVALFFYSFYPLLCGTSGQRIRDFLVPGLILAMACQTRIALLPLMLTPLATAIMLLLVDGSILRNGAATVSGWRRYSAIAAPAAVSALLLLTFYTALNLFGSIQLAREVATSDVFRSGFSSADFFDITMNVCLASLLATIFCWRKVVTSPLLVSLWIFIIGYLAMLYFGQIITWERYWAPVAGASVFTALTALGYLRDERVYTAAAVTLLGAQFYFIFHHNLDLI